jgi:hypothetical protein
MEFVCFVLFYVEESKQKEKLVAGPRWAPDTMTDWPSDFGRNVTMTFRQPLWTSGQSS